MSERARRATPAQHSLAGTYRQKTIRIWGESEEIYTGNMMQKKRKRVEGRWKMGIAPLPLRGDGNHRADKIIC